jgi:hypothetical protein
MPMLMIIIRGTTCTHLKEQHLLTSTNADAAHLLKIRKKKKKNRIPYSKPEQVAIYLEIQGNSSSPTPLIFLRNASQNAARGHKKRKHL